MHPETETVLDRRRMRRSLTLWRALGIAALAIAFGALVLGGDNLSSITGEKEIARVAIEGTITEDRDQLKMLKKLKETDRVAGVIVFVNSPGGTTAGGEGLYEAIRDLAKEKPVVAQFGTVAASAGYIVGLATDHIVARGNSITGSMGVLAQWPEVSDLLDKIGVKVNEVKSGELKASPSPFKPLDEKSRKVMQDSIDDGFRWFRGLVEERRGIETAKVDGLVEGRIFSGREALSHKLVDEIGGEAEAVKWLETEKGLQKDLDVVDWKPEKSSDYGLFGSATGLTRLFFGDRGAQMAEMLTQDPRFQTLGLDGMISVWHPSEN